MRADAPPAGQNRITPEAIEAFLAREQAAFARARPASMAQGANPARFWQGGPLHWMADWPSPVPLVITRAQGTQLSDADGHAYVDFCLGDTGAMFGHAPAPVAMALNAQSARGYTTMLASPDAPEVAARLQALFGLPHWQLALSASDANRFAIRVARAATGRTKVLVFDGCYHGAVEEAGAMRDPLTGATLPKPSLWGQVAPLADLAVSVPFNDLPALHAALASGDIACVLTEPALTNIGIIAPEPGFLASLRAACTAADVLLIADETHTISTGPGGGFACAGIVPDMLVVGKAIAGGFPAAAWGFSDHVAGLLAAARARLAPGHSGVGTTLAGSALALSALRACLTQVMTQDAYGSMRAHADGLEQGLTALIARHRLDWCVVRVGARMELVFAPQAPRDAQAMRAVQHHQLESALHLGLLNRGYVATPFHCMFLCAPCLPDHAVEGLVAALDEVLTALIGP